MGELPPDGESEGRPARGRVERAAECGLVPGLQRHDGRAARPHRGGARRRAPAARARRRVVVHARRVHRRHPRQHAPAELPVQARRPEPPPGLRAVGRTPRLRAMRGLRRGAEHEPPGARQVAAHVGREQRADDRRRALDGHARLGARDRRDAGLGRRVAPHHRAGPRRMARTGVGARARRCERAVPRRRGRARRCALRRGARELRQLRDHPRRRARSGRPVLPPAVPPPAPGVARDVGRHRAPRLLRTPAPRPRPECSPVLLPDRLQPVRPRRRAVLHDDVP